MDNKKVVLLSTICLLTVASGGIIFSAVEYSKERSLPTVTKKYKTNAVYSDSDLIEGNIYSFNVFDFASTNERRILLSEFEFDYIHSSKISYTPHVALEHKLSFRGAMPLGPGKKYKLYLSECKRVINENDEEEIVYFSPSLLNVSVNNFITPPTQVEEGEEVRESEYYLDIFGSKTIDVVFSRFTSTLTNEIYKFFSPTEYNELVEAK